MRSKAVVLKHNSYCNSVVFNWNEMKDASVLIQSAWRSHLARQEFLALMKTRAFYAAW